TSAPAIFTRPSRIGRVRPPGISENLIGPATTFLLRRRSAMIISGPVWLRILEQWGSILRAQLRLVRNIIRRREMATTLPATTIQAVGEKLYEAERAQQSLPALTETYPGITIDDAYAIQRV